MKINIMLTDVCSPEDWILEHPSYVTVPIHYGMTHQELTEAIANAEIKGKDLLSLAANQQSIPGVITIQEAEYLGLPHTVFQGFALLDENAEDVWLGLADNIRKAVKDAEFEPCEIPEGMSAYYLLEFNLGES